MVPNKAFTRTLIGPNGQRSHLINLAPLFRCWVNPSRILITRVEQQHRPIFRGLEVLQEAGHVQGGARGVVEVAVGGDVEAILQQGQGERT